MTDIWGYGVDSLQWLFILHHDKDEWQYYVDISVCYLKQRSIPTQIGVLTQLASLGVGEQLFSVYYYALKEKKSV